MQRYRLFLKNKDSAFVRIPKKLLADPKLTDRQKILWMVLASYMYGSEGEVYPGRELLSRIMHIKNPSNISRLTGSLQDGCYLEKQHYKSGGVLYELYFDTEIDESIFLTGGDRRYRPSKRNRIRHPQ